MYNHRKVAIRQAIAEVQKLATAIKRKQEYVKNLLEETTPLWRAFYIFGILPGNKRCKEETEYFQDEFLYLLSKSIPGTHEDYLVYLDQLSLNYPNYLSYFYILQNFSPKKDDFVTDRLIGNMMANLIYSEALEDHKAFGELLSWLIMASLLEGCEYDFEEQVRFNYLADFFSYCSLFMTCRVCKKLGFFYRSQGREETLVAMLQRTLEEGPFKKEMIQLMEWLEKLDPEEDAVSEDLLGTQLQGIKNIIHYFSDKIESGSYEQDIKQEIPDHTSLKMLFGETLLRQEMTVNLIILYNTLQLSNLKAQKDMESYKDELLSKDKKIASYRNKNTQLSDKVKYYKNKLEQANRYEEKIIYQSDPAREQELIQLRNSNAKLKSRIVSLEAKLSEKDSSQYEAEQFQEEVVVEVEETPPMKLEEIVAKLNELKITVVGGPPYYAQKINSILPKARVFDKNCQLKEIKIGKADVVVIFTKIISHAKRIQAETQASKVGAKIFYIDLTNQELFCRELYQRIFVEE